MAWQWDDVRFFLAVARAGSLSGAARALGVGHVTVGRRITLLEKRLGVTLLNRTPDGFATTSAGQAIYANVWRWRTPRWILSALSRDATPSSLARFE
jgi:DNA-binding transcriptional LysR family regulator